MLSYRLADIPSAISPLAVRPPPEMSDSELLRFGSVAKYLCSLDAALADSHREALLLKLQEARREWNSRFPQFPLCTTFDQTS
jgi:hypothetical protein